MKRPSIAFWVAVVGLLALYRTDLAKGQSPVPVTPSVTPGPGAYPFTWGVDTQADLPGGPHRAGLCMSAWDTGRVWCWTGGAWASPSGGGGGSGTVTSFSVSGLPWFAVANSTTAPVLSPAGSQTPGLVVGTCGSATTVGLCAMTAGMVPTLNQSTTGNAATATALASTPSLCASGSAPRGVLPSGNVTGCAAFLTTSATYAASASTAGPATTALALNAAGATCSSGSAGTGVDASGNATGCTAYVQPTADINSSNQVIATHLTAPETVAQGGTGVSSLPACVDTGGNHLNFNAGVWSCGNTSSGGGGLSNPLSAGTLSSAALQVVDPGTGLYQSAAHFLDLAANGARGLSIAPIASATDYLLLTPSAAGGGNNGPKLSTTGSDANADMLFDLKGSGARYTFFINGVLALDINAAGNNSLRSFGSGQAAINGTFISGSSVSPNNDSGFARCGSALSCAIASGGDGSPTGSWAAKFWETAVGASVSSASTITPTSGLFHVTGIAAISTINLPFAGFTGCIKIIPDGAFATTAIGGNIALASTAVVSRVLTECYDGTSWYPSY